jgi:NADH-quinone oxidoreductase subunit L
MLQNAWLIVWLPLIGFVFNILYPALVGRERAKKAVALVAPAVVLGAFGAATLALLELAGQGEQRRAIVSLIPGTSPDHPWIWMGEFRVNFGLLIDPLSMLMTLIVTGVGGLIHVYATGYMGTDPEQPRFFAYFNLFIFMMLLLVMGENFLLMFVGWEGVGTCSYLLISFWHKQTENAKAGNKAFIVNRVGDLGFALGMMAVWSVFGTLSFRTTSGTGVLDLAEKKVDVLGNALSSLNLHMSYDVAVPAVTLICILLFIGAMGKSAQIPLWVWLPDAMAGPTPVSALIHAATMVTAGVVMVTRCSFLFVQAPAAMQLVGWIGLATAFVGATIGLVQNDIKRVLAFSTVSQLGYMFLACGVGAFSLGMFHVTTHAFFKALLFLGSGAVIHSMLGEQDMRKMGGLKRLIPKTHLVMLIGTLAIAGVPGLSGFWSKDEILHAAQGSPWGSGAILYGVGILTAFMTAFYMNRLMWKTFYVSPQFVNGELPHQHHSNFDDDHGHGHNEVHGHGDAHGHAEAGHGHHGGIVHESPPSMLIPLYILAAFSLFFGLAVGPTHIFTHFLEPSVAKLELGGLQEGHHLFSAGVGYGVSAVVAFAGLYLAVALYQKNKATGMLMPETVKRANPLYNFLLNKWYWDHLYNGIFISFGGVVANGLWKIVDTIFIDGTVKLLAYIVGGMSQVTRQLQTGYVRNYALAMLFGVVILVCSLLFMNAGGLK